jgi:hypothetical protein
MTFHSKSWAREHDRQLVEKKNKRPQHGNRDRLPELKSMSIVSPARLVRGTPCYRKKTGRKKEMVPTKKRCRMNQRTAEIPGNGSLVDATKDAYVPVQRTVRKH